MIKMAYVVYVNDGNGNRVKMSGVEFSSHENAIAFTDDLSTNNPELAPVAVKVMRRA